MGILDSFLKAINPPKKGATDEELYAWRILMVVTSGGTLALLLLHFAWVAGAVPFFEDQALAKQQAVAAIQTQYTLDRKKTLIREINDTRKNQCMSTGRARELYREDLQTFLEEYKDLNSGRLFELPACDNYEGGTGR